MKLLILDKVDDIWDLTEPIRKQHRIHILSVLPCHLFPEWSKQVLMGSNHLCLEIVADEELGL